MIDEVNITPRKMCYNSTMINNTQQTQDCLKTVFIGTPKLSTIDSVPNARTPKTKFLMGCTSSFNILPVIKTPPRRFPKVFNPFDSALTDRLHMPIICR